MGYRVNGLIAEAIVDAWRFVHDRLRRDEGQTFVEYTLVLLIVAVAATALFIDPVRNAITDAVGAIGDAFTDAGEEPPAAP
jgi:Flp pilus assembly pilin Flp